MVFDNSEYFYMPARFEDVADNFLFKCGADR